MTFKPTRIIIPLAGISSSESQPRAVYDQVSHKVLTAIGAVSTMRASHVDVGRDLSQAALAILAAGSVKYAFRLAMRPDRSQPYYIHNDYADFWFADMTPCGHSVVLGPYDPINRDKALADEVAWLQEHNIPTCTACIASPTLTATGREISQPTMQNLPMPKEIGGVHPRTDTGQPLPADCWFSDKPAAVQQGIRLYPVGPGYTYDPTAATAGLPDIVDVELNPDGSIKYQHDINGLPICPHCKHSIRFDIDEPFAHCNCATMEWGDTGNKYREIELRMFNAGKSNDKA